MRFFKSSSPLWYTVQAVIGTILEEAALFAVFVWLLPLINFHVSWWGLALLMLLLLGYSAFTYMMGMRALRRGPFVGPGRIIGREGVVVTPLMPSGYVKIHGELWKASCDSAIGIGEEIIVTKIDGLRIIVIPKAEAGIMKNGK